MSAHEPTPLNDHWAQPAALRLLDRPIQACYVKRDGEWVLVGWRRRPLRRSET